MNEHKKFAVNFALEAGKIIKKNFKFGMSKDWKSDNTPVTETDNLINSLLIKKLKQKFSNHALIAEEESNHFDNNNGYVWVCDPIDGTIPFSHGVPISTFSLALVKNGEPILAVVYNPFDNQMYTAEKGKGAYLNNKRISVSKVNKLRGSAGNCEMYESAKYETGEILHYLEMIEGAKCFKLCSVIYGACLVAVGELAFTIFPGRTVYDVATAKLIVEEAGGKATDVYGKDQRYDKEINGLIASNGVLHNKLVKLSKKMTVLNK